MSVRLLRSLVLVALALGGVLSATAQATELKYDHRVAGDRSLTIHLGPVFPSAFQKFDGSFSATNLSVGGTLGIDLDFYLNDEFRLGGGLRGKATASPNSSTLFMVPITFRGIWEPKFDHFSFPMGLGLGFSFTNFRTATSFDPILMPTIGAYWNMTSSWSFGADATQWIVFQPYYGGGAIPTSDSRIAYFADLTLGAIYHF
jgi:hypothetical protein